MTAVWMLNLTDRGLMVILLQPIKQDLQLSDAQLGFLTGPAFGIFYAIFGLYLARWADRGNRITIASLAIGLWGLIVMASVLVMNFAQLAFVRMAAAVGEAGCKPPTYSLVGDYFPGPAERTRAMSIYWLGGPLSALISYAVGGWMNGIFGWRVTFLLMGIPGLLLAILVKLTITEPRTNEAPGAALDQPLPSLLTVLSTLWNQRSSRHLSIGLVVLYTMGQGLNPWYGAFMVRSHGIGIAELGVWLGLITFLGGITGTLLGGYVAGRWFPDNERGQIRMVSVNAALLVPGFVIFLTLPQKYEALFALVPLTILSTFFFAPTYALMQRLVPNRMRATALSTVMLFANLLGMGIGSVMVGVTSDFLLPIVGSDSLRYAMLTVSLISLWSAFHFWQAGRTIERDLATVENRSISQIGRLEPDRVSPNPVL